MCVYMYMHIYIYIYIYICIGLILALRRYKCFRPYKPQDNTHKP